MKGAARRGEDTRISKLEAQVEVFTNGALASNGGYGPRPGDSTTVSSHSGLGGDPPPVEREIWPSQVEIKSLCEGAPRIHGFKSI